VVDWAFEPLIYEPRLLVTFLRYSDPLRCLLYLVGYYCGHLEGQQLIFALFAFADFPIVVTYHPIVVTYQRVLNHRAH
jgi:hypothetical protein